ncbi:glycosyltransferase family protein [Agromyces marinus]|uniref:Uncharacterized protein n=1 Tax=Agromyces marinus TaxID=1389020 RepID=A0ABN6YEE1_9MICO|nr:glycosyltransferase [Agromyces marinus]UIP58032.1 hypothetical protein DSM26151_09020 [Agromyces marinus]BDZ53753.1 hypothetical protein GCM10025870_08260 [Agromyces marinus]
MSEGARPPAALVISQSPLQRDPRVRRQMQWLAESGWIVDTLGLGERPDEAIRDHFAMHDEPRWARPVVAKGLIHTLLPYRRRFEILSRARIPREAEDRVRSGEYGLIVFNDIHLLPWTRTDAFSDLPGSTRVHLDLHEHHPPKYRRSVRGGRLANPYYAWGRAMIADPVFTSRSAVVRGIAELYQDEFAVPPLAVIRNAPELEDLEPSAVREDRVELVHHGAAAWTRGLREMVDAVGLLPERFRLTLMLLGSAEVIAGVEEYAAELGDRVRILPPVPMREIASSINAYDIEVMFFPPVTENLRFVLPNKLFEAVQGRLALAIGPSVMMAELIEAYGNGTIASGWTAEDLADSVRNLTADDIRRMKNASAAAAQDLNAAHEGDVFRRAVGIDER